MTATTEESRNQLRAMTRGAYDLQKLRIQAGLRLCANFRSKLGQGAGTAEDELDDDAVKVLDELRTSYRRLTDGIAKNRRLPPKDVFKGDELISEYTDLMLVASYFELEGVERKQFAQLETVLPDFPIYVKFLKGVRGIGPAMAGVLISEIDIRKAAYPSSLWKYAGLDLGPDGRGRSRRGEHLVDRQYTTAAGEDAVRKSITYNPFLKTKLMGVIASSFLRTKSPYAKIYADYKHRLETDPARAEWSKGRRHQAAMRYMAKQFLKDLYNAWRPLEGLTVAPTYQEAKLGHVHRAA
jgi:hypothetical protein